MLTNLLLPVVPGLQLQEVLAGENTITVVMRMTQPEAACPLCHRLARRIHSHYLRKVADVPWSGVPVSIRLRVRRFFCENPDCHRKIFTERLHPAIAPYARRTRRLQGLLESIGLTLGGEAGVPLAHRFGISTSADTLLRIVRRMPEVSISAPRIVGVDDWAKRKRHTYGTILVDLEQHRPIDLLPDREPKTLTTWLRQYPSVEMMTRDRSSDYAQGATDGAPQATQIVDRWHLLKNWREAVQRLLEHYPTQLRSAAQRAVLSVDTAHRPSVPLSSKAEMLPPIPNETPSPTDARYAEIKDLQRQGLSQRAIARRLHLHRKTVSRYVHATSVPERARGPQSVSTVLPYFEFLKRRWGEGCHNAMHLWKELHAQGYAGSYSSVHRVLRHFPKTSNPVVPSLAPRRLSAPQASWLLVQPAQDLTSQEEAQRVALCEACPVAATVYPIAQAFGEMVRARQVEKLDAWLAQAEATTVPELKNFAASLQREYAAVHAALALPWSNGQVEGQINRLKTIKRQMYGRGKLDLLRQRVLYRRAGLNSLHQK